MGPRQSPRNSRFRPRRIQAGARGPQHSRATVAHVCARSATGGKKGSMNLLLCLGYTDVRRLGSVLLPVAATMLFSPLLFGCVLSQLPSRPRFPRSLHPRSSCAQPSCTSRRSRCRAQLALVCRHAWRSPKIAWSRAPTRRALPTQMVAELGEMVGVRSKPKIAEDITQLMHACSEKTRAPAPGWQGRLSPTDPPTAAGTRRCSSSGGRAMGSTRRSC